MNRRETDNAQKRKRPKRGNSGRYFRSRGNSGLVSMEAKRVLFVGRSTGHLVYYQSVLEHLAAAGANIELIFDKKWSSSSIGTMAVIDELRENHPQLVIGWLTRREDRWRSFVFGLRELRSFRSYLTRRHTTQFYIDRWHKYLTPALRGLFERRICRSLLAMRLSGMILASLERLIPPDQGILRFLKAKRPDVLVVSPLNMRFSEETDYTKAARKLRIPTLLPVYSWDNLSTKGLIQIAPDIVMTWNEYQKRDALEIHKVPTDRIRIGGAPFFDRWFEPRNHFMTRDAFYQLLGFDADLPLLLYLGSSTNIATDESWLVEAIKDQLESFGGADTKGTQILVRPHPANAEIFRRLSRVGIRVWPQDGALPTSREEFSKMQNSFRHANASIGINTSGMIDSVLSGLPTFTIRLREYDATQADTLHFQRLAEADALHIVGDLAEFIMEFRAVLSGHDTKRNQRLAFAERFIRPLGLGVPAGKIVADSVLELAGAFRG